MGAKTIAARVIAAQKDVATAKQIGLNAALRDSSTSEAWGLASLRGTYKDKAALLAIAEGAYYGKLQILKQESSK